MEQINNLTLKKVPNTESFCLTIMTPTLHKAYALSAKQVQAMFPAADLQDQYQQVAEALAQDLREYADAANEAGEAIDVTENLLSEFDVISNQINGFAKKR